MLANYFMMEYYWTDNWYGAKYYTMKIDYVFMILFFAMKNGCFNPWSEFMLIYVNCWVLEN